MHTNWRKIWSWFRKCILFYTYFQRFICKKCLFWGGFLNLTPSSINGYTFPKSASNFASIGMQQNIFWRTSIFLCYWNIVNKRASTMPENNQRGLIEFFYFLMTITTFYLVTQKSWQKRFHPPYTIMSFFGFIYVQPCI